MECQLYLQAESNFDTKAHCSSGKTVPLVFLGKLCHLVYRSDEVALTIGDSEVGIAP